MRVPRGDCYDLLAHGPFDLLVVDGGDAKRREPEAVLEAARPERLVVLDDPWPEGSEPPELRGTPDPVRAYRLNAPRWVATEVVVGPTMAVTLAACVAWRTGPVHRPVRSLAMPPHTRRRHRLRSHAPASP